ncbi:MAG TPA: outer membrane lipoprotein-sorting protein [Blastocatellia bacterium]|nr:outer membrane lipoprotein-sorting protein [Blastocatellia bacterium]
MIAVALLLVMGGCGKKLEGTVTLENANSSSAGKPSTAVDAAPIVERYRTLDKSHDSTMKMRASISDSEQAEMDAVRSVQLTMYRKHQSDGRLLILVEFTAPGEERDRDGLITVFPDGQIEGVRYVQSNDSFIVTRDLMTEDALFGLTLQELADGQPEKYDFMVIGEETLDGTAVYRLEGKLKQGTESKFPRVVLLISKQNFAAVQAEFHDSHDELARMLSVSKTEQVAGYWTRMRWTIDNRARQKKVDFEALDVRYDQGLKDSIFTREYLKKIASR